jgi:hypothetical protein
MEFGMRTALQIAYIASLLSLAPNIGSAMDSPASITDCSRGCTIVTCDTSTCAINIFEESRWSIAATYPTPSSLKEGARNAAPVRKQRESGARTLPSSPAEAFVLAPTSAEHQYAKVCASKEADKCAIYSVGVKGALLLEPST